MFRPFNPNMLGGPAMMDLHSFHLVSTATSLWRQVAAVCHGSDRKPGYGIFKIRARISLRRPKGIFAGKIFIFNDNLYETILIFLTGT